jgi:spermidine synthase
VISLASIDHKFGRIDVYQEKRTGDLVFLQGGCFQTKTDRDGLSLVAYVHALFGLVMQAQAQTILMIGCGGGSLASMLAKAGKCVTVVDVNPAAIDIASEHFALPEGVDCHVIDGAAFLRSKALKFDAIVMDAYCGDQIPVHMRSTEFFLLTKSRLSPHGCFFANVQVIDDADPLADQYAQEASKLWRSVRILDVPGATYRNAIVAAGSVDQMRPPALIMSPANAADAVEEELARAQFRAVKGRSDF